MRTLKVPGTFSQLSALVLFLATTVSASQELTLTGRSESPRRGSVVDGVAASASLGRVSSTVSLTTRKLADQFDLGLSVTRTQTDYEDFLLVDRSGNTTALATEWVTETSASPLLVWIQGPWTAQTRWNQSTGTSKLPFQKVEASLEHSFRGGTRFAGFEVSRGWNWMPESYFIDSDLRTRQRPTLVNSNRIAVFFENVLSESTRWLLKAESAHREEERPRNWGLETKLSHALNGRNFLFGSTKFITEPQTGSLQNERGYMSISRNTVGYSLEPSYDWLITTSYGVLLEREEVPNLSTQNDLGTDEFGLRIRYSGLNATLELGALRWANRFSSGQTVEGGATWEF